MTTLPADRVRAATRHRRAWQAMAGLATAFAVLVAVAIATSQSDETAKQVQFESQVAACKRGNLVRAYLIADAAASARKSVQRVERASRLFPILNCERTTRVGTPVPLPIVQQRAYIRAVIPPLR